MPPPQRVVTEQSSQWMYASRPFTLFWISLMNGETVFLRFWVRAFTSRKAQHARPAHIHPQLYLSAFRRAPCRSRTPLHVSVVDTDAKQWRAQGKFSRCFRVLWLREPGGDCTLAKMSSQGTILAMTVETSKPKHDVLFFSWKFWC